MAEDCRELKFVEVWRVGDDFVRVKDDFDARLVPLAARLIDALAGSPKTRRVLDDAFHQF